jgi:hypothetical protein
MQDQRQRVAGLGHDDPADLLATGRRLGDHRHVHRLAERMVGRALGIAERRVGARDGRGRLPRAAEHDFRRQRLLVRGDARHGRNHPSFHLRGRRHRRRRAEPGLEMHQGLGGAPEVERCDMDRGGRRHDHGPHGVEPVAPAVDGFLDLDDARVEEDRSRGGEMDLPVEGDIERAEHHEGRGPRKRHGRGEPTPVDRAPIQAWIGQRGNVERSRITEQPMRWRPPIPHRAQISQGTFAGLPEMPPPRCRQRADGLDAGFGMECSAPWSARSKSGRRRAARGPHIDLLTFNKNWTPRFA